MPALSIRIALDCFYLLIFYSEKFSTDVCRLPYAVNVNRNLSNALTSSFITFENFVAILALRRTEGYHGNFVILHVRL